MGRFSSVLCLATTVALAACATRPPAVPQAVTLTVWALDPTETGCDFADPMATTFGFATRPDTVADRRARRHVYGGLVRLAVPRPPGRLCLALIRWDGGYGERVQALYGFEGRPLDRDRVAFRPTRMLLERSTADPGGRAARVGVTLGLGDAVVHQMVDPGSQILTVGQAFEPDAAAPVVLVWPFGAAPTVLAAAVSETRARGRFDATLEADQRRQLINRLEAPPRAGS